MPESPASAPQITAFPLGGYQTNCYVVRRPDAGHEAPSGREACWIADLGMQPEPLLDYLESESLEPLVIVLTHCHIDHIAGLFQARSAFPEVPIWVHSAEEAWLSDPMLNLSALSGMPVTGPDPSRLLRDNETLDLLDEPWEVRHTPGHSPGSVSLVHHASNQVLAGDALFNGSIGRTDFPGCDFDTLANSIRTRLYDLPDETTVYPGHGPSTTIGREKRTNPFVRPQ